MKHLLRFLRAQLGRFGFLPVPEPEQLDFLARLAPSAIDGKARQGRGRRA
jgi:hypothetical protein